MKLDIAKSIGIYSVTLTLIVLLGSASFIGYKVFKSYEQDSYERKLIVAHIAKVNNKFNLQKAVSDRMKSVPVNTAMAVADRIYYLSEHTQIPIHIICGMIEVESGWNPNAVSAVNAKGLMQIMPATARPYLALDRVGYTDKILFDPTVNVTVGVSYLKDLHDQYVEMGVESPTDFTFSINTYFWGSGNVYSLLGKSDSRVSGPNFSYYRRVMTAAKTYKDLGL